MSAAWQSRDTHGYRESRCRTRHIRTFRGTVNKTTWSNPRHNTELFYFSVWVFETPNERASIYHERACEREYIPEYLQRTARTGNGFNKIMRTGNGFNKKEILFEATRTCVWLKLDVCSMCVRFATRQRDTSGLINYQVQYFAKANSAFTIFFT